MAAGHLPAGDQRRGRRPARQRVGWIERRPAWLYYGPVVAETAALRDLLIGTRMRPEVPGGAGPRRWSRSTAR